MANKTPLSSTAIGYIEMFEQYLTAQNYRDKDGRPTKHFKKRVSSLRAFLRHWELVFEKPGGTISKERVEKVVKHMHEVGNRSHATLVDDLAALRAFFRCLMEQPNPKVLSNFAEGIKAPGSPKRKRVRAEKELKSLVHQILLRLDDEQHDYLLNLLKDGCSVQDVLRRIIEEHRSFQHMATALKIQHQTRADLEKLLDAHTESIKDALYDETISRMRDALTIQTYMMCMFMAESGRNAEYMFTYTQQYVGVYFPVLYERIEAEVEALRLLSNKAA